MSAARLEAQRGQWNGAIQLLMRAAALAPRHPEAHFGIAELSSLAGRPAVAAEHYRLALEARPGDPAVAYNYGVTLEVLGEKRAAADAYREALRRRPGDPLACTNLGCLLMRAGELEQAAELFDRAIAGRPDLVEAQLNRALVDERLGRLDEAEQRLTAQFGRTPGAIDVLEALLRVKSRAGADVDSQLDLVRAAMAGAPQAPDLWGVLVTRQLEAGRVEAARESLLDAQRRGLASGRLLLAEILLRLRQGEDPDTILASTEARARRIERDPYARLALAHALLGARRDEQATGLLRPLLAERSPGLASSARIALGCHLHLRGDKEAAAALFDELVLDAPTGSVEVELVLGARIGVCDWRDYERLQRAVVDGIASPSPPVLSPGALQGLPRFTADDQKRLAAKHARQLEALPVLCREGPVDDGRRLRVGFLSGDFREHAVAYLCVGMFEQYPDGAAERFAYSYGTDEGSPTRQRLARAIPAFRSFAPTAPDQAIAQAIVEDRIDILVDLGGWTGTGRPGVVARRPAPLIVNWLGYPGTMGDRRLADYIVGDPVTTPPESAEEYSETLALMPHCYQPNDDRRQIDPHVPSRAEAGLPDDAFVYCSFNRPEKITPEVFDRWCEILRRVPRSVLWLLRMPDSAERRLRDEAATRGVDATRLVFAPPLPLPRHLARVQLADLALDTFPYNSHTTGSDALWAGVPMLTLLGSSFAARVGASLVTAARCPELVARDEAAYVEAAVEIAGDRGRLESLRTRIRAERSGCPLFDTRGFAEQFDRLMNQIWRTAARDPSQIVSVPARAG